MNPGRSCPLSYRYPPAAFARRADFEAETIYVIGGLYGNLPALEAILTMAMQEPVQPRLVFNGDFNWFNVDPMSFEGVNRVVCEHLALRGNVETELLSDAEGDAGCGCAYPDYVDDADVERSNQIMQRLRATATVFPQLTESLTRLPMHAVASVGGVRIGIVHGDAESLAGWRFAHDSLHEPENVNWLQRTCRDASLAGFASSHTCLPTFRRYHEGGDQHFVINNGAAGMPNFANTRYGLLSRLSVHAAPEGWAQYGDTIAGIHVDAIPVHYDHAQFEKTFLQNWPPGSPAHHSYFKRISEGPAYYPPHALGLIRAPSVCA